MNIQDEVATGKANDNRNDLFGTIVLMKVHRASPQVALSHTINAQPVSSSMFAHTLIISLLLLGPAVPRFYPHQHSPTNLLLTKTYLELGKIIRVLIWALYIIVHLHIVVVDQMPRRRRLEVIQTIQAALVAMNLPLLLYYTNVSTETTKLSLYHASSGASKSESRYIRHISLIVP
jgi:hypothetical protein